MKVKIIFSYILCSALLVHCTTMWQTASSRQCVEDSEHALKLKLLVSEQQLLNEFMKIPVVNMLEVTGPIVCSVNISYISLERI